MAWVVEYCYGGRVLGVEPLDEFGDGVAVGVLGVAPGWGAHYGKVPEVEPWIWRAKRNRKKCSDIISSAPFLVRYQTQ